MESDRDQKASVPALVAVTVLHVLAIYGLMIAFNFEIPLPAVLAQDFIAFNVRLPMHPPTPKHRPAKRSIGGRSLMAGKRAEATPVPVVAQIVVTPSPMVAAISPAAGTAIRDGAGQSGPGSGGGGAGNGQGAGAGDGEGDGTDLRLISGDIRNSDYPRDARRLRQSGNVHIRFTVGVNGRVTDCSVTRSSGSQSLDDTTCRLIRQRFRYAPSRDGSGRPFADVVDGVHEWRIEGSADIGDQENGE